MPAEDPRLLPLLEACYGALAAGDEPDLERICSSAPDLCATVARLLARERLALRDYHEADGADSPAPSSRAIGMPERLGDFVILEPLGVGGMSRVYRARQEPLGREVALKVLREEIVASETGRLRFQREATMTAALDHPNIVPVYAAGEAEGHVYLAMKLLRGRSLDRHDKPLAPAAVAKIGIEVARALQAAHDVGVVHRDVKPANIVVERDIAYVLDFGLSSFMHTQGSITRPDSTPGTLVYIAPELVARRGAGLDPRVDIYGLGVVLYELLSGHPPFSANNPIRLMHDVLHRDPPPLALRGRDRDLATIVARAMVKAPGKRFQTAAELADDLERWRDGLPIRARRVGWFERALRHARRRPALTTVTAVCVALGIAFGTYADATHREREALRQREITEVESAIAAGDTVGAARRLQRLAADSRSEPLELLRRELAAEQDVQTVLGSLHELGSGLDPAVIAAAMARIRESATRVGGSARTNAVLAVASRAVDDNPVTHLPLSPGAQAAHPRLTKTLSAWARGEDLAMAPGPQERSAEAMDHVLTALTLALVMQPAPIVERELRLANATGRERDAIHFSLAIAAETAQRYADALDLQVPLVASPTYGLLARCGAARCCAFLGRHDDARTHLAAAESELQLQPHLRHLVVGTQLDVLLEVGDLGAFWLRWREEARQSEHLPHYWLRAGHAVRLESGGAELATAREHYVRARACLKDHRYRAVVDFALLHLDWEASIGPTDFEPVASATTDELDGLRTIARAGEHLVERMLRERKSRAIAADALLVAAQAWRASGDRERGWQLLEDACRDFDAPEPLARYSLQTGLRVLRRHLGQPDRDTVAGPELGSSAAKGVLRARGVIDRAAQGQRVDPGTLREAQQGLLLCAVGTHDSEYALPMALALRHDDEALPRVIELAQLTVDEGGARLEEIMAPAIAAPKAQAALLAACSAMRRAVANGTMLATEAAAAIERWRQHPRLGAALRDDSEFALVAERVAELAAFAAEAPRRAPVSR